MTDMKFWKDGKLWGEIKGNVYVTHRTRSKHLCKKFHGYGVQQTVYDAWDDNGVGFIDVIEDDTGMTYRSTLDDWHNHSVSDVLREEDGLQRFLSLNRMRIVNAKSMTKLEEFR